VLMRLLPALAEARLEEFGAALTDLQQTIGDHFAPAQGGRYASRQVEAALQCLADGGAAAWGQSSWGPTGFAIFGSETAAGNAVERLRARQDGSGSLSVQIAHGCNRGAQLHCLSATADRTVSA
jgi:beta-ribofuranosylaminobenzene 5'-phosphate synthase